VQIYTMNEILGRKNKAITALIRIQLQYNRRRNICLSYKVTG
jgi:hypothetical protein